MKPASGAIPARDVMAKMVATFFGLGYSRFAPGTLGSLAGFMLAWFAGPYSPIWLALFLFLGFIVCRPAVRLFSSGDPACFIMDEVCGMMVAVFLIPKIFYAHLAGFALFRFFDILKPWPISWIQKSKHPSAILWDDLLAGLFANLILRAYLLYAH